MTSQALLAHARTVAEARRRRLAIVKSTEGNNMADPHPTTTK
jgi:hypothetical protein